METYGVTNEDFGRIAVVDRATRGDEPGRVVLRAADNPRGPSGVALDRRNRCSDSWTAVRRATGGVALVVTSVERARDLRQPVAVIEAAAQGRVRVTAS